MKFGAKGIRGFLGCLLFAVSVHNAVGQSINSSIQGTVADSSGAVMPDAEVTLKNVNTGLLLNARTNSTGSYSFPSVSPGSYALRIVKSGFANYEVSQFNLIVGQRATQDVTLGVVSATQAVTVNGGNMADLLQPESNDLGTVIGPQSVSQLPLNGRNFLQLGLLSGASQTTSGAAAASVNQTGHPSLSLNIAGNQPDMTMYLIDGIKTYGSRAGNASLNISVGAIDQFEVHYGFFMPDLGSNPGIVDVITKGGTNRFHGEAYEFVRTNQMAARNYFSTTPPGPYHQNQFGGDLGGPIWKNKLFFFANYEGYRQSQSAFVGAYAPTAAMFNGDFSSLSTPIYDPSSFSPATGMRKPFAGNIIPLASINTVSKKLLAYYLPGSSLASSINLSGHPRTTLNSDQITFRSDLNVNDRNQIFGQVSWLDSPATSPGLFPLQGVIYPLNTELIALGWTNTLSQTKVNELRIGWTRNSVYDQGVASPGIQTQLGLTGTADINGVPSVGMTGFAGFGTSTGLLGDVDNVYEFHDSFSWLHGHHQIKFGGDVDYTRTVNSSANATARGSLNFTNAFSSQIAGSAGGTYSIVPGTGNSFADFLLGTPTNGEAKGMPPTHYRWTALQPYLQDTWKVTPKFTANVGLAWYGYTPPNPINSNKNLIHSFDFNTGLETFAALGQISPTVYRMTRINFAPRIGFSYALDDKTVVRSGYGIYYTTQMALNVQYSVVSQIITVNNSISNAQPVPTYTLGVNAFPPATVGQITASQVAGITGPIQYLSDQTRSPYIEQWNFDVQHSFGRSYLLDIGYVGSSSHHLALNYNPLDCSNPANPADLSCNLAANNPYNPKYPYMQEASSMGWGNYNGLIVKFQRQFSNGISIIANYTWAKSLAAAQEGSNSTLNQRRNCIACDYGPTTSNVPQSLVFSAVADLPFGRGRRFGRGMNRALDLVAGGWSGDFISTFQSGNPFTVTSPNFTVWSADQVRANRLCNGRNELQNKKVRSNGMLWLQKSCFAQPATGYFGNSGFDVLNGPGLNNTDLGAHKSFSLTEQLKFTLRGEFFNAWNHTQFANPDSGVADANFGKILATRHDPRQIQIGGTITF